MEKKRKADDKREDRRKRKDEGPLPPSEPGMLVVDADDGNPPEIKQS